MAKKKTLKLKELLNEFYLGIAYPAVLNSPLPPKKKDNFSYQVKEEKLQEDKFYASDAEKKSIANAIGHDIRNELVDKVQKLGGPISKFDVYAILVELVEKWYASDPDIKKSLRTLRKSMNWLKIF
jgi:hypothetical protein